MDINIYENSFWTRDFWRKNYKNCIWNPI